MRAVVTLGSFLFLLVCSAQFGPPSEIVRTPDGPTMVYDHDGDGDLDLIIGVLLYKNTGDGSFLQPREPFTEMTDFALHNMRSVKKLAIDVNNDGILDIVTHDRLVFISDGSGGFLQQNYEGFGYAHDFDIHDFGDIDGDGDVDMIWQNSSSNVYWYSNDGIGLFTFAGQINVSFVASWGRLGDLDGDGDLDVLLNSERIRVNNGTGVFPTMVDLSFTSSSENSIVADLNNDGIMDIADVLPIPSSDDRSIVVRYNLGNFQFTEVVLGEFPALAHLHVDDVDEDGDVDLLVNRTDSGFVWVENLNSGNWSPAVFVSVPSWHLIFGEPSIWWHDMDGDGHKDVVTGAGWVRDNGDQVYSGEHRWVTMPDSRRLQSAHLDENDRVDLMVRPTYGSSSGIVGSIAFFNDGTDNLTEGKAVLPYLNSQSVQVVEDLNGDGSPDQVWSEGWDEDQTIWWTQGTGNGYFGVPVQLDSVPGLRQIRIADVNGDGLPDIMASLGVWTGEIRCWRNLGNGDFSPGNTLVDSEEVNFEVARDFVLADMDADGDLDLFLCDGSGMGNDLLWKANDGNGFFTGEPEHFIANYYAQDPILTDHDGDGDADIICVGGYPRGIQVITNNGLGAPLVNTVLSGYDATLHLGLRIADLDMDGHDDIIFGNMNTGVWAILATGNGGYGPAQSVWVPQGEMMDFEVMDVNGDGASDLVVLDTDGELVTWRRNLAAGTFAIGGAVYNDVNGSGTRDDGEPDFPFCPIHILSTPTESQALVDDEGRFLLYVSEGTHALQAEFDLPFWEITSPLPMQATVDDEAPQSLNNDIGVHVVMDTLVMRASLVLSEAVCSGDAVAHVGLSTRLGTRAFSGHCTLLFDTVFSVIEAPTATLVTDSTIVWMDMDLQPWEVWSDSISLIMPDVEFIGTTPRMMLQCVALDGNATPVDTVIFDASEVLLCSYDPNDKQVYPRGFGEEGVVPIDTERLTYTVRFQNTGNAPARDVTIMDNLPPQLRRETMHVLASTHSITTATVSSDGVAVFRFENIYLPDSASDPRGSQGSITFSLLLEEGLPSATYVVNDANIYFDLNEAIVTQPVVNKLVDCSLFSSTVLSQGFDELVATVGIQYQWYLNDAPLVGANGQLLQPQMNGAYTVAVTNSDGCTAISPPYVLLTTSSPNVGGNSGFSIRPVPLVDEAIILLDDNVDAPAWLDIVDAQGRTIRTIPISGSRTVMDRLSIATGVYQTRLVVGGTVRGWLKLLVL